MFANVGERNPIRRGSVVVALYRTSQKEVTLCVAIIERLIKKISTMYQYVDAGDDLDVLSKVSMKVFKFANNDWMTRSAREQTTFSIVLASQSQWVHLPLKNGVYCLDTGCQNSASVAEAEDLVGCCASVVRTSTSCTI